MISAAITNGFWETAINNQHPQSERLGRNSVVYTRVGPRLHPDVGEMAIVILPHIPLA